MFGKDEQLLMLIAWVVQNLAQLLEFGLFTQVIDAPRQVEQPLLLRQFLLQIRKRGCQHAADVRRGREQLLLTMLSLVGVGLVQRPEHQVTKGDFAGIMGIGAGRGSNAARVVRAVNNAREMLLIDIEIDGRPVCYNRQHVGLIQFNIDGAAQPIGQQCLMSFHAPKQTKGSVAANIKMIIAVSRRLAKDYPGLRTFEDDHFDLVDHIAEIRIERQAVHHRL